MDKHILCALGDISFICKKDKYSHSFKRDLGSFLINLITYGQVTFIYKLDEDHEELIASLKEFCKECQQVGLVVEEIKNATLTEHGYHSGSWDVQAYGVIIRFPMSPAAEILYGKK